MMKADEDALATLSSNLLDKIKSYYTLTTIEMTSVLRMKKSTKDKVNSRRLAQGVQGTLKREPSRTFSRDIEDTRNCFETECGECFITDIMDTMNIGAPTVSHHMKELSGAGLVITERKGKFLTARINDEMLKEIVQLLSGK
jgi:DNA-binding transcriptional ArsR family regulator